MNKSYTLENFYTHKGNEVAFLAAKKIIELPGEVFNPFYVYGTEGLGKTHLLNAINGELRKNRPTILLSVSEFERQLDENTSFNSPLIVDDIHTIRDDYKGRLLEIIERAVGENVQVCLSAAVAPQDVKGFSPSLCALLESGLICNLQPAVHEDRTALIKKKAEDAGIILPDDLAETLAQVSTGSIKTIVDMINRLVTFTSLGDIPSDEETLRTILSDFYPKKKACVVPSVLALMKGDDLWQLSSTERVDQEREYEQKIRAWQAKGFNVSPLRDALSDKEQNLGKAYGDFLEKAVRLIELQRTFYDGLLGRDQAEVMQIESMLFDPEKVAEIEKLFVLPENERNNAEAYRKFSSFLIGACNREAWSIYHDEVLENLGQHSPCFVFGTRGTGKTHFLEAICSDLISRGKRVVFSAMANEKVTLSASDIEDNDVLILDDFHVVLQDESRLNSTMTVIEEYLEANKQVFIGAVPFQETLSEQVRCLVDGGLSLELASPSADVVQEYLRRHAPEKAAALSGGELPMFDSFFDIDYYIKSLGDEELPIVPLGLPGESTSGDAEVASEDSETAPVQAVSAELLQEAVSVDIEDESRYMMPEGPDELVEEKF